MLFKLSLITYFTTFSADRPVHELRHLPVDVMPAFGLLPFFTASWMLLSLSFALFVRLSGAEGLPGLWISVRSGLQTQLATMLLYQTRYICI
jgi:hypothetical protein